LQEEPLE